MKISKAEATVTFMSLKAMATIIWQLLAGFQGQMQHTTSGCFVVACYGESTESAGSSQNLSMGWIRRWGEHPQTSQANRRLVLGGGVWSWEVLGSVFASYGCVACFLPCSLHFLFNLSKEDVEHRPEFRVLLVLK